MIFISIPSCLKLFCTIDFIVAPGTTPTMTLASRITRLGHGVGLDLLQFIGPKEYPSLNFIDPHTVEVLIRLFKVDGLELPDEPLAYGGSDAHRVTD